MKSLGLEGTELSLVFASSAAVRKLNREYRGKDYTTDVLSFPLHDFMGRPSVFTRAARESMEAEGPGLLIGDIVIDPEVAARQARQLGHSLAREIERLVVHGLLHLLGYDHEGSAYQRRRMAAAEREMLDRLS